MVTTCLTVTLHDPVIARDSRPFGTGQRMGSLDWLYPSVLAGSLRTILGNISQADFQKSETIKALKNISIAGPLPLWDSRIFLPAPKDILVKEVKEEEIIKRQAYVIRPTKIKDDEGCGLPFSKGALWPAMLPIQDEFKPAAVPAFWSTDKMVEWLKSPNGKGFLVPPGPLDAEREIKAGSRFLSNPQKDMRSHVKIDQNLGTAQDEMLFRTVGLDLSLKGRSQGIQLAVRVEADRDSLGGKPLGDLIGGIDYFGPLGGERRLAHWKAEKPDAQAAYDWMQSQAPDNPNGEKGFPDMICTALNNQDAERKRVRLVLATPAIFSQGWLPQWLNLDGDSLIGAPYGAPDGLKLKLISACVDRWKPISGWCLEKGRRGQKKIRRLVPAGSVYFFEVLDGDAKVLVKNLWLRSVCDKKQDRLDGFGLALWGVWDFFDDEEDNMKK